MPMLWQARQDLLVLTSFRHTITHLITGISWGARCLANNASVPLL